MAKRLDACEEAHLPAAVREWVARGNLTHDVYHDGEQLRFRWTDKTARLVLRDMRRSGLPVDEALAAQLDAFVVRWTLWDEENHQSPAE